MAVFTSTLPDDLWLKLNEKAASLQMPKNKLIERAVALYLEHLNKAEYIKTYRAMADDSDVLLMAEEGMSEYLNQIAE